MGTQIQSSRFLFVHWCTTDLQWDLSPKVERKSGDAALLSMTQNVAARLDTETNKCTRVASVTSSPFSYPHALDSRLSSWPLPPTHDVSNGRERIPPAILDVDISTCRPPYTDLHPCTAVGKSSQDGRVPRQDARKSRRARESSGPRGRGGK